MSSQIGKPMRTPRTLPAPGSRGRLEHALLVELAVIGQVDLEALGQPSPASATTRPLCRPLGRFSGVPMAMAGPPSAVSATSASTASSQAFTKAGFRTDPPADSRR
jgi:hypothetical protein